jgi:ERCC4-type nuclease
MIIKVDTREPDLLQQLNHITSSTPSFKNLVIKFETLPIGDIIICDDNDAKPGEPVEKLIIERKSVSDLMASIKDGRYEEQSYRLNGINHHNHNIIYLVEGDVSRVNRYKPNNTVERLTLYSAMFSLNYYKGFSVFRSFSLEESALIICNMAYKLDKELSGKKAFYKNNVNPIVQSNLEAKPGEPVEQSEDNVEQSEKIEQSEKDYVNVVKKVKKENITPDNIGEIMLCQIPGISSVTALAIMEQYKNIPNLIKELEANNDCLKDITSTNSKGQTRKINKTSLANIVKFLLKK